MTRQLRLLALATLAAIATAQAQIQMAFHNGTTTVGGMTSRPAGTVVNTGTSTWNNLANNSGVGLNFTNFALLAASGTDSGARLAVTAGFSGYNSNGWGTSNQDSVMMEGWYGLRAAESLTVTNLPAAIAAGFSVIVYGDSDSASRAMNYTIGGTTRTIQDNGTFSGTFATGANFVTFTGLTGSSFTLTGNPGAADVRSAVNGVRIIPDNANPAPTIQAFTTNDAYVTPGTQVTLSWQTSGAQTLSISPGIGVVTGPGGSRTVTLAATTTFTLTATNSSGSSQATVRVASGPPRPNILLFLVDDMGWQDTSVPFHYDSTGQPVVTALNQRYRTPNMESLAASGMKFTRAYAHPVCTPTRISLMTGRNAARHRVTDWTSVTGTETSDNDVAHLRSPTGWLKTGISPAEITLPKLLGEAGYRTIHTGKAHFGSQGAFGQYPQALGFDINIAGNEIGNPASYYGTANFGTGSNHVSGLEAYHGQDIFLTEALTLEMNKALEKSVADGVPFFAYMAQYAVHSPFNEDPRFAGNYPSLSGGERAFATLIEGMDKSLGDIRAKLETLGVAENTLIVFMSDNGGDAPLANNNANPVIRGNAPLRGKKGMRYEGGIRVPVIVAWAKAAAGNPFQAALPIPAGSRQSDLVHVTDWFPTLLGEAAVPFSQAVDGHDLRPYLTSTPGFHRPQSLVTHFPHGHNNDHFSVYHEGDWKLIFNYADESPELYNLAADLGEQTNLAASQPARMMSMTRALARQLGGMNALFSQNLTIAAPQPPRTPALPTVDADGDGLPDLTEDPNRNGLVDPGETDPDATDSDADGTGDGAETALGTNPLNPGSSFQLRATRQSGGTLELTWPSQPGNRFDIRFSPDLADWSTLLEAGFPAIDPGTTSRYTPPPSTAPRGFYRVELK